MTDRELLELAAKAYWGDEIDDVCSIRWLEADQAIGYTHGDNQDHNGEDRERVWSPIESDGDALRLAVKCKIDLKHYEDHVVAWWENYFGTGPIAYGADPSAATRSAIVRAAAAIGKEMP